MSRRNFLSSLLALGLGTLAGPSFAQSLAGKEVKIGYQKNGVLYLAKQKGEFEQTLKAKGLSVKWVEFSFGPPLLEALNLGSIDYGTTGDAPPIFAQAAGANLLYVAAQEAAGSGSALLVAKDSPIQKLEDLKGKKVGFSKASSAHNLTIAALEKAGLTYQDITPVYLAPADGAAAFAKGAIDVWTIWDPFYAVAEYQPTTRVLAEAKGIVRQNSFFLANKTYTQANPDIIALVNTELAKTVKWAEQNRDSVSKILSEATGIPLDAQKKSTDRTDFVVVPINQALVAEQQRIADRFHALGLIPHPIKVDEIIWTWKAGS